MGEIQTDATNPTMYRHQLKAAKKLGNLWVKSHTAIGKWETSDGDPVFLSEGGGSIEVKGHGHKYFEVVVDGEVRKVTPVRGVRDRPGKLRITLTDNSFKGERIDKLLRK